MRALLSFSCIALALALVLPAAGAEREEVGTAVLSVSSSTATVGDRIDAVLQVTVPEGYAADRPDPGQELGKFRVSGTSWEGPVAAGGKSRFTLKLVLAAFETGTLEIPPIEIKVRGGGSESLLSSSTVKVEIRSVLGGSAPPAGGKPDLADLKPPASMPADYRPVFVALGILAALLAAAAAAWWIHRLVAPKLAAVKAPEDPFRRLPPHVWAYAELQRLLEGRLADEGDVGQFFNDLSRILKLYLGGRYRLSLLEQTTGELPALLKETGTPQDAMRSVRSLLERCDGVKFARELPDVARCRESVEEAYRIVDATRPLEEPKPAEKGAA